MNENGGKLCSGNRGVFVDIKGIPASILYNKQVYLATGLNSDSNLCYRDILAYKKGFLNEIHVFSNL